MLTEQKVHLSTELEASNKRYDIGVPVVSFLVDYKSNWARSFLYDAPRLNNNMILQ